jgi:hypothetical protein
MTIIQQPDAYSLTSTIKDFIVESEEDITFEITLSGQSILKEVYTPDSDGKIYIRGLGKFFENYLTGHFDTPTQPDIVKTFAFNIDADSAGSSTVLLCKAITNQPAEAFFQALFLNLQYRKKITLPESKEFITLYPAGENKKISTRILYWQNDSLVESSVETTISPLDVFCTINISFAEIAKLFPDIDRSSIVAYFIGFGEIAVQYAVDWERYLDIKTFIYLNSFGVPDSLACRGEIYRKGISTFNSSKINDIEHKFDVKRADTFEVSSGKIYSRSEYLLFREMFTSEEVKVFFAGQYRKIIITDENMNVSLRPGALSPVKFTFRLADPLQNSLLPDNFVWILEDGTWIDNNLFLDNGQWNDGENN